MSYLVLTLNSTDMPSQNNPSTSMELPEEVKTWMEQTEKRIKEENDKLLEYGIWGGPSPNWKDGVAPIGIMKQLPKDLKLVRPVINKLLILLLILLPLFSSAQQKFKATFTGYCKCLGPNLVHCLVLPNGQEAEVAFDKKINGIVVRHNDAEFYYKSKKIISDYFSWKIDDSTTNAHIQQLYISGHFSQIRLDSIYQAYFKTH